MDSSEKLAEEALKAMGFTDIVFEPDGNVPPDFLANARVAIEVRRLNQNVDAGNGKRGLEETSIPLWRKVQELAHSLGGPTDESWFVFIRFARPLRPWKKIRGPIRDALEDFKSQAVRQGGVLYSETNFQLEVIRASKPLEHFFRMGGNSDEQSGGFVVAEMLENIDHCAEEKLKKIEEYRSRYPEWWLVLIDHIGLGIDEHDKKQLLSHAKRPAGWDKIVIVNPHNPDKWFEF